MAKELFTGEDVHLPTGGNGFTPAGTIGRFYATMAFASSYIETELPAGTYADVVKSQNGKFKYYFTDLAQGTQVLKKQAQQQYGPQQVWVLQASKKDILWSKPEAADNFKTDPIKYEVDNIVSFAVRKLSKLTDFQLLALPMAVNAYARYLEYIDHDIFTVGEMFGQETIFDDNFQARMCGYPDTNAPGGGDPNKQHYTEAELWQRRTELWNTLGEANPKAYALAGNDNKVVTTADKLRKALRVVDTVWNEPVWIELVNVPDPRASGAYGDDGKRRTIPCINRIFGTGDEGEAAAKAYFEEQQARFAKHAEDAGVDGVMPKAPSTTSAPVATNGNLKMPVEWAGQVNDWKAALADAVKEGKKAAEIKADENMSCADLSVPQITAWIRELGTNA
jgi:hypothetical protein